MLLWSPHAVQECVALWPKHCCYRWVDEWWHLNFCILFCFVFLQNEDRWIVKTKSANCSKTLEKNDTYICFVYIYIFLCPWDVEMCLRLHGSGGLFIQSVKQLVHQKDKKHIQYRPSPWERWFNLDSIISSTFKAALTHIFLFPSGQMCVCDVKAVLHWDSVRTQLHGASSAHCSCFMAHWQCVSALLSASSSRKFDKQFNILAAKGLAATVTLALFMQTLRRSYLQNSLSDFTWYTAKWLC